MMANLRCNMHAQECATTWPLSAQVRHGARSRARRRSAQSLRAPTRRRNPCARDSVACPGRIRTRCGKDARASPESGAGARVKRRYELHVNVKHSVQLAVQVAHAEHHEVGLGNDTDERVTRLPLALAKQLLKPRALPAFGLAAGFGLGRLLAAAAAATGRHVGQHLLDVGAAAGKRRLFAVRTLHSSAHDSLLTRQAERRRYGVRAGRGRKDSRR